MRRCGRRSDGCNAACNHGRESASRPQHAASPRRRNWDDRESAFPSAGLQAAIAQYGVDVVELSDTLYLSEAIQIPRNKTVVVDGRGHAIYQESSAAWISRRRHGRGGDAAASEPRCQFQATRPRGGDDAGSGPRCRFPVPLAVPVCRTSGTAAPGVVAVLDCRTSGTAAPDIEAVRGDAWTATGHDVRRSGRHFHVDGSLELRDLTLGVTDHVPGVLQFIDEKGGVAAAQDSRLTTNRVSFVGCSSEEGGAIHTALSPRGYFSDESRRRRGCHVDIPWT